MNKNRIQPSDALATDQDKKTLRHSEPFKNRTKPSDALATDQNKETLRYSVLFKARTHPSDALAIDQNKETLRQSVPFTTKHRQPMLSLQTKTKRDIETVRRLRPDHHQSMLGL